ncbi:hypothetical protein GEMRC1_006067 [Eukaryota sp. GEM-RC1]
MSSFLASYLRPGQVFRGCQIPGGSKANWDVELSIRESNTLGFSGVLKSTIPTHQAVYTLFHAELIDGIHTSFFTTNQKSNPTEDIQHWSRFKTFKDHFGTTSKAKLFAPSAELADALTRCPGLFFRIEELCFLQSVHSAEHLTIEGFYFAQYSKSSGAIEGYYYERRARPGQKLQLRPVTANNIPDVNIQ